MDLDALIAGTERANSRKKQPCKWPSFTGTIRTYLDRVAAEVEDPMPAVVLRNVRNLGGSWGESSCYSHYRNDCGCPG